MKRTKSIIATILIMAVTLIYQGFQNPPGGGKSLMETAISESAEEREDSEMAKTVDRQIVNGETYLIKDAEAREAISEETTERKEAVTGLKSAISLPITSWTDGKYQNISGELIDHSLYSVSDMIDIHDHPNILILAYITDLAAICLFDEQQNFIDVYWRNSTQAVPYAATFNQYTAPKAYYVRICTLTANKSDTIIISKTSLKETIHVHANPQSYANCPSEWRNCNTLPENSVIGYYYEWPTEAYETMLNFPIVPFNGEIITVDSFATSGATGDTWGTQIALYHGSENKTRVLIRSRYTSWGNWKEIGIPYRDALIINDNVVYAGLPVACRDCDTIPVNTVWGYHFSWTEEITPTMLHFPVTPFLGTILTYNVVKNAETFGVQIAFEEYNTRQRMWYRTRFTEWSRWHQVADTSMIPDVSSGAFRGLGDFVLCGDSLSVSISYKAEAYAKTVKSWGKILAGMIGSSCDVFAQGGITTGGFLASSLYTNAVANESQFAILYLGTNDANQSVSASTFKSNYKSIINGLLQNHQFVFCVNLPACTSVSTRDTYNAVIEEVCEEMDYAFLVNVAKYNDTFAGFKNWGHLSSMGYAAFAEAASWAIDETMLANDYFDAGVDFPELE